MIKKLIFYFLGLFLLITFIISFDFVLSNTVLKNKNCYKFQEYYYELKKNCKAKDKFKSSFPNVNVYTDNLGLRVKKNFIKRNKDKKNILIFGDSFTFGVGLEHEETYVGLIEKKLTNYNFFNFAVSGYSPSVYLYKLNQMIKSGINPNKIVLFLDLSDVLDEASRWEYDKNINQIKLTSNEVFKKNLIQSDFKSKNFKVSL